MDVLLLQAVVTLPSIGSHPERFATLYTIGNILAVARLRFCHTMSTDVYLKQHNLSVGSVRAAERHVQAR